MLPDHLARNVIGPDDLTDCLYGRLETGIGQSEITRSLLTTLRQRPAELAMTILCDEAILHLAAKVGRAGERHGNRQ